MSEKLQKMEPSAVSVSDQNRIQDPINLLSRAVELKTDPAALEKLLAMHERLLAAQAKREFDEAMTAFQSECPVIGKERGVRDSGGVKLYSYAAFEDVIAAVKPFLQKHGFSFDLNTDVESKDGWVVAICTAKHRGGHSESKSVKLPISGGTRAMSTTQIYAAALSFASRRAFQNAFGIICAGEDKDGKMPTPAKGPSSARDESGKPLDAKREAMTSLWKLLKDVRGTCKDWDGAETWLRSHKIIGELEAIPAMTSEQLGFVLEKSEIQLQEGAQ